MATGTLNTLWTKTSDGLGSISHYGEIGSCQVQTYLDYNHDNEWHWSITKDQEVMHFKLMASWRITLHFSIATTLQEVENQVRKSFVIAFVGMLLKNTSDAKELRLWIKTLL